MNSQLHQQLQERINSVHQGTAGNQPSMGPSSQMVPNANQMGPASQNQPFQSASK